MLLLALIGTALAQSPVATLQAQMAQPDPPRWALSCSPASDVIDILRVLPLDDGRPEALRSDPHRTILPLLKPGALEALGLDLTGPLTFAGAPAPGKEDTPHHISIPFKGNEQQASALVEALFATATPGATPGVWELTHESDKEIPLRIEHKGNTIVATAVGMPKSGMKPEPAMLADMSTEPGCAFYGIIKGMKIRKVPPVLGGLSLYMPTRGNTMHVRLLTTLDVKTDLSGAVIEETYGSSRMRPTGTMLWTMDPMDLLAGLSGLLPPTPSFKKIQTNLSKDNRPINIPPGMVTVGFENGGKKDFAAVIPVRSRRGYKIWAGTLAKNTKKVLEGFKVPVERTSRTRLKIGKGNKIAYAGTKRGLLFVASNPELLEEMLDGKGTPWVSEPLKQLSRTSALAVEVDLPPTATTPATEVRAGLGMDAGRWDLRVQVEMPELDEQNLATVLTTLQKMNPEFKEKLIKKMAGPEVPAEVSEHLMSIRMAQNAYMNANDKYLEVAPWPRPVIELTPESVPWQTKKAKPVEFDTLGWTPKDNVSATYWVELSEDGATFTVFGAMDADGDGNAAIYKLTKELKAEPARVSPAGVY